MPRYSTVVRTLSRLLSQMCINLDCRRSHPNPTFLPVVSRVCYIDSIFAWLFRTSFIIVSPTKPEISPERDVHSESNSDTGGTTKFFLSSPTGRCRIHPVGVSSTSCKYILLFSCRVFDIRPDICIVYAMDKTFNRRVVHRTRAVLCRPRSLPLCCIGKHVPYSNHSPRT
jgi:hypothetical protein